MRAPSQFNDLPQASSSLPLRAEYVCSSGCSDRYDLDEIIYTCPKCGALLEIAHDLKALQAWEGQRWQSLFDLRLSTRAGRPEQSGVWSKREWVQPGLTDQDIVTLAEGGTPLLAAEAQLIGCQSLWIKQCGTSHTGSFKDLGMTVLVSQVAKIRRKNPKLQAVGCASTGDTSAALAAYCARAKIPSLVLLPEGKISPAQLLQPIANGALVCALRTDFDGCMKVIRQLSEGGHLYLANSLNSLRIEGQKTVAIEICQQLGWKAPDWIVIPGGNLGNVSALAKGLEMMQSLGLIDKTPRIACAQAGQANPLYLSSLEGFQEKKTITARKTLATAIQIGNPVSYERAVRALKKFGGAVEQATEQEIADAAALADRTGLLICPHTAVALAVARKLVAHGTIEANAEVVVVSTAHGLKFMDFKARYHEASLEGIQSTYRNQFHTLEPDFEAVLEVLGRTAPT